jgi:hypothetical protein
MAYTLIFFVNSYFLQAQDELTFTKTTISGTIASIWGMDVADFTGDNYADIITAHTFSNKVYLYTSNSASSFSNTTISTAQKYPFEIHAADVDKDGNMDIVIAYEGNHTISWLKNNGSGGFTAITVGKTADGPENVATGDIDGDGNIDVVATSIDGDKVQGFKNNGDDTFATAVDIGTGIEGASEVIVKDMNNDNRLDVVVALFNGHKVYWYENGGNESFTRHNVGDARWCDAIHVVDIDGDNDMDIFAGSSLDDNFYWFKNTGTASSPSFSGTTIDTNFDDPSSIVTADLDGDNDLDIVVSSDGGKVFWFKNDGSQTFTKETIDGSFLGGAEVVRVFDMDNDSDLDVIVAGLNANTVWYESNASTLNVEVVYPQTAMLYPNPTARVLQLDYMADTNTEYGLFDITGKRLTTFTKTGKHHTLDVSNLSKGTYLLKATSGLQFAYYRFVKQ